jgi:hypothetical protein
MSAAQIDAFSGVQAEERSPEGWHRRRAEPRPDLRSLYAQEVLGAPSGWDWYEFDASPDRVPAGFLKLRGAVAPLGPRTGRPDWSRRDRSTDRTLFIERARFEAWQRARAERLDECIACQGAGEVLARASAIDGAWYRTCRTCGGDGKHTRPEGAA